MEVKIEDIKLESLFKPEMSSADPYEFIENLKAMDGYFNIRIKEATKEDSVLRYVARIEKGVVSVGVENIKLDSPLGSLKGTDNQIAITSRRYEPIPSVVTGPGAGAEVTAAGVLNDIVAITMSGEKKIMFSFKVPATVGNVGPGFDVLGLAVDGLYDRYTISESSVNEILVSGIDSKERFL